MATEKKINSRIQQKHDVAANWAKATNFIPKKGEIIIYDAEYNASGEETQPVRFKIGDGSKTVNNLPFAVIDYGSDIETLEQEVADNSTAIGKIQGAFETDGTTVKKATSAETANKVAHYLSVGGRVGEAGEQIGHYAFDGHDEMTVDFDVDDFYVKLGTLNNSPHLKVFQKPTGVTAGKYNNVTVDEKGHVTNGESVDYAKKTDLPDISGLMPKSGGTFTGEVKFGSTENFQGYYIKRMIGSLGAGTRYADLDSSYKDGTWHRMWRLRFPSGSNFWGKIKVTLYGNYSSFNASGVMSKSITCNFNTSSIYNNVGCYDGLGVNVEQDFRISEAIWNATASAWEVLIWQKNLNGNNSPVIMLECWTSNNTSYINAFNGIAAQTVELTQSTSYSAQRASSTGGTKTVEWATLPVYENPLGEEIATVAMLEDKQDKITSSNKLSASLVSGLSTVATSGSYDDLANKPSVVTTDTDQYDMTGNKSWTGNEGKISIHRGSMTFSAKSGDTYGTAGFDVNNAGDNSCGGWSVSADVAHLRLGIDGACDIQLNENAGTSGQVLTSQGAGNTPIWTTPSGGGATDAVKYTAQTLTASQKSQARSNIGAGTGNGTVTGVKINGSTKGTSGVVDLGYIQVKLNGTTYTADSSGFIDLGTISGGTTTYNSTGNNIY